MRNLLLLVSVLAINVLNAQTASDNQLNTRLEVYMRLNKELKFEELMNYVHPSLFKIAPKEQMIALLKQTFDNEKIKMSIDSTAIVSVSPSYKQKNALYKQIRYFMIASIAFKDSALLENENLVSNVTVAIKQGFPDAQVAFNTARKVFEIQALKDMFAIQDMPTAPWKFLGIENKNPQLVRMLFPEEVIKYFKLL